MNRLTSILATLFAVVFFVLLVLQLPVSAADKLVSIGSQATYNVKDEDSMTSDSEDAIPTQQSVKAYVDARETATQTYSDNYDYDLSFTVAAQANGSANSDSSNNTIEVTAQVVDLDADTVSGNFLLTLWLSESATTGAINTNAPDGSGTPEDGLTVDAGQQLSEALGDEAMLSVLTNSTGAASVEIEDDDTANDWYMWGSIGGTTSVSGVIDHN